MGHRQSYSILILKRKELIGDLTPLPAYIKSTLKDQVQKVRHHHDEDLKNGLGEVYMPGALGRKYRNAAKEFRWQYVFPAKK